MARRGSRKVTPMLVADSFALLQSLQNTITVLRRWHPTVIPLVVIESQVTALEQEFKALEVAIPAPDQVGMFQEEA